MKELILYSAKAHLYIIGIMIIQLTPVPYTLVATPEKKKWTNMTQPKQLDANKRYIKKNFAHVMQVGYSPVFHYAA